MLKNIADKVLRTDDSLAPTALRVGLGSVMFAHGAQKALGWWGGAGFEQTMEYFTASGMPGVIAFLVIAGEFLGGAALVLGFGGRIAAAGIGVVMVGAIAMVHGQHGFFMNWYGAQAGEGYEYHLLAIALSVGVVIAGSGAYSLDRWLSRRLRDEPAGRADPALA